MSIETAQPEPKGRARLEAPDLSEKGGLRNGQQQRSNERLFMQFLAFGECRDTAAVVRHVSAASLAGVVYEDVNDPHGIAILALSTSPEYFLEVVRPLLVSGPFVSMTLKPQFTML